MDVEKILIGSAGIVLGILILIKTGEWIVSLIPIIIGIALIIFRKEEGKVEKRRDKK